MISILDKLFGNQEQPQQGTAKNIKHSRQEIADLLLLYKQYNYHLSALLRGDNKKKLSRLTTGIEAIEMEKHQFMTDAFQPQDPEKLIQPGTKILFSLNHNGVRHQFECTCTENTIIDKVAKHWFDFPKGIEMVQLRNAFRVQISQAHPIKVTLTHEYKETVTGTLADLSSTGMRMRIEGLVQPKPERGDKFSSCHFVLSDGSPVVAAAQLIHWQYDQDANVSFLGLQFDKMDGSTQRALNRYLTDLQRKQRQLS